jgi:hypothetical protein
MQAYPFTVSPFTVYRPIMNRQSAAINGFDCSFALEGNRNRPVVVLSHSLATSMEIWGYQLPLLQSSPGRSCDLYRAQPILATWNKLTHLTRSYWSSLSEYWYQGERLVQGTKGDKKPRMDPPSLRLRLPRARLKRPRTRAAR